MMKVEVPVLDFGPYLDDRTSEGERAVLLDALAERLRSASREVGFYFLKGAGALVPAGLVREMFEVARSFHGLDLEQKLRYGLDARTQKGYMPNYADVANPSNTLKSGDAAGLRLMTSRNAYNAAFFASRTVGGVGWTENPWPDDVYPEMQRVAARYDAAMDQLVTRMLPVYARALGLPAEELLEKFSQHALFNYRLTHYPETPESPAGGGGKLWGIYPHADTDCFTILAQNDIPGLSLKLPSGEWMPVPALPDAFLVNTGEFLHRMTNGKWLNTVHRAENKSGQQRYAVVCFVSLDKNAVIDAILEPGETPIWGARFTGKDIYLDIIKNPGSSGGRGKVAADAKL